MLFVLLNEVIAVYIKLILLIYICNSNFKKSFLRFIKVFQIRDLGFYNYKNRLTS